MAQGWTSPGYLSCRYLVMQSCSPLFSKVASLDALAMSSSLHSYSCSSQDPGPIAKEYSDVSIPGAQHLPPSSLAQMSTQAPKLEELVLRAGTESPRLRTDRR